MVSNNLRIILISTLEREVFMVNVYNKVLGEDEVIPLTYDRIFKLIFGDPNHLERLNLLLSVTS